jgi:hypothetical protein
MNTYLIYFSIVIIIVISILYYECQKINYKLTNKLSTEKFVSDNEGENLRGSLDDIDNEIPFYNVQNTIKNYKSWFLQAKSHNIHFVSNTAMVDENINFETQTS